MTLNTNQFEQAPVRGQLDLSISKSGVISGQVSANEAGTLKAGDPVILDSANTGPVPQFKIATQDLKAIGYMLHTPKKDSLVAGDAIEVALFTNAPVMFMLAGAAINPGVAVENNTDDPLEVVTLTTHARRGYALDPAAAAGDLIRVIIDTAAA